MTSSFFSFGQQVPGYTVPVLNERAVRAAAGLLFFGGMVSFMNAWLLGNFGPTRIFVLGFLLDFGVRLFVNPRLAPTLVLGQWLVRRQRPEWTGAAQKRFAWAIGMVLALVMAYLVILKGVVGPLNLMVCGLCLTLMFFETAFGICIGCWVYQRLRAEPAPHCPGDACAYEPSPHEQQGLRHLASIAIFALAVWSLAPLVAPAHGHPPAALAAPEPAASATPRSAAEEERCKVPEFAKAMGHEEKWKLHNHCQ